MSRVTAADLRRALEVVEDVHSHVDTGALGRAMRDGVVSLIAGEVVAYSEVSVRAPSSDGDLPANDEEDDLPAVTCEEEAPRLLLDVSEESVQARAYALGPALVAHGHENPLLQLGLRHPRPPVAAIDDFLSLPAYRETAIYREFFSRLRFDRQIAICPGRVGDVVTGVTVHRKGLRFSRRDRELLSYILPHFRLAFRVSRRIATLERRHAMAQQRLANIALGFLLADADGCIERADATADEILKDAFRSRVASAPRLPAEIAAWLRAVAGSLAWGEETDGGPYAIRIVTPAGTVEARWAGREGGSHRLALLLTPHRAVDRLRLLMRRGLTRREAEVLLAMIEGSSNRDIAAALAISTGTVRTHVERILSKLDAPNRTAATRIAAEWFAEGV